MGQSKRFSSGGLNCREGTDGCGGVLFQEPRLREHKLQRHGVREPATGDTDRHDTYAAYPLRDQRRDASRDENRRRGVDRGRRGRYGSVPVMVLNDTIANFHNLLHAWWYNEEDEFLLIKYCELAVNWLNDDDSQFHGEKAWRLLSEKE